MANRTEKEKFFARLDALDESTETESESETERNLLQQASRKRQRLSADDDVRDATRTEERLAETVKIAAATSADHIKQSRPAPVQTAVRNTDENEYSVQTQQSKPARSKSSVSRAKPKFITRESSTVKGLFDGLTFFFIPNDDVAKPRKLRIQSAVAQGAIWARKLESGITHVIVDPDIAAPAVTKYVRDNSNISGVPFVKMNWLIEGLSHKSVRDPSCSRFQLKGSNLVVLTPSEQALPVAVPAEMPHTEAYAPIAMEDAFVSNIDARNELDQIVQSLKAATELPFDEEIDLDNFLSISSGDEQADDTSNKPRKTSRADEGHFKEQTSTIENKRAFNAHNKGFSCMQSNPNDKSPCANDRTIAILQQMATYYDRTGDNWRTLAYRRAITALRKHDANVKTAKEARAIPGIGSRLADKIEEIVTTNRLKRLDAVLSDPDDQVLQLFMGIYGVGLCQAKAWMEQGHRTLEDLIQNVKLTANQKIGIEHHTDFAQRIPRVEVKQHGDIVAQALKKADRNLQSIIGGSYRRGNGDSGDIDVIITHPTATLQQLQSWIFDIIVPHLFDIGFMKCALATSRAAKIASTPQRPGTQLISPSGAASTDTATTTGTKFHGASQLPPTNSNPTPPWRRIDLLLVPPTSIGAALIYFTGNDIFNRSLRLLASKKGMRLNQHGLYKDVMRGKGRVKITEGELVEGRSERKIFGILGVPWRSATERNC